MLPKDFVDNMRDLLGVEADDFLQALSMDEVKGFNYNYNLVNDNFITEHMPLSITKSKELDNVYLYTGKIGATILNHAGVVYSQDPSAMIPALALGVEEGDVVLDVCAAPGGKSIQILRALNGSGLLVANEYVYKRAKILFENLTKTDYHNFAIINSKPADYDNMCGVFDKILVDAPCSGEGMFRKSDIDTYSWSNAEVAACAARQLEILESVSNALRRGGKLVYSTCTYNRQENEKVVAEFLRRHSDYRIIDLPENLRSITARGYREGDIDTNKAGRRYPHLHIGEGQFVALLMRDGDEEREELDFAAKDFVPLSKKDKMIVEDALRDVLDITNIAMKKRGNTIYALPDIDMDYSELNVLSVGAVVGTISRGVLKINHNFYRAYGKLFYNQLELSDEEAKIYLTGNIIECNRPNGIVSIIWNGLPLGGGKVVNGVCKNYYPAELRNQN